MASLSAFDDDDQGAGDEQQLDTPEGERKIDFQAAVDTPTGAWLVASEREATVVDDDPGWFTVEIDGRGAQTCHIRRVESGEWVGVCSCDDWDVSETSDHDRVMPCADLSALRRALFIDEVSLDPRLDDHDGGAGR